MNEDTFNEVMDALPAAFPLSRIVLTPEIKFAFWKELELYRDEDFLLAIGRIRRSEERFPAAPSVIIRYIEEIRQERFDEEYRARKREDLLKTYTPKDLPDPTDKQMAEDTFRAISEGLSTGPSGIVEEMRRLAEKYPKKRDWFNHTAFLVEQDHKEVVERDEAINGAHKCPEAHKPEVVIQTAKTCQKCKTEIEKGLWCEPCRTALYKAKEAVDRKSVV